MKIIIELELSEKTTVLEIKKQLNIPNDLIAKDDEEKLLSDGAQITNDDEIIFTKPEMINIILHFDNEDDDQYVKILEGSTVSQLIEQIKDKICLPEKFELSDLRKKPVDINYILQNYDNIKFTKIQ